MDKTYLGVFYTIEASLNNALATTKVYSYVWERDRGNVIILNADKNMHPFGSPAILVYATFDMRYSRDDIRTKNFPPPPKPELAAPVTGPTAANIADFTVTSAVRKATSRGPAASGLAQDPSNTQLTIEFTDHGTDSTENRKRIMLEKAEIMAKHVFDTGLEQLRQGMKSHAVASLEKPLFMPVPWEQEHKHMFSTFGMTLRKEQVYDLALRHHAKALSLSPKDTNIMFNIARVHACTGNFDKAEEYLLAVFLAEPELEAAFLLQEHIDKSKAKQQNDSGKLVF